MMITAYKQSKGILKETSLKSTHKPDPAWIDVFKPSKEEIKIISDEFLISEEIITDAIDKKERPRLMEIDNYSLIIFRFPLKSRRFVSPLAIFISKHKNLVITIRTDFSIGVDKVLEIYERGKDSLDKGISHLVYRLLDAITEAYGKQIQELEERIEKIEDHAIKSRKDIIKEVFLLKKALIYYHKSLLANRDVISAIEKDYASHVDKRRIKEFRALYFDIVQLIETTSTQREILSSALEIYISNLSTKLNVSVQKLTAWGALILIPTVISGIYGMNFRFMPELEWQYGYFFSIGLMLLFVIPTYLHFQRRGWL